MNFKTAFGERERYLKTFSGVSRAHQSFKAECDINTILSKWQKTGVLEHVNKYDGQYGDFTSAVEYQEALNMLREADDVFMSLPSSIRKQFDNDPAQFLDFVDNPDNRDAMREMGLLKEEISSPDLENQEPDNEA